MDRRRVFLDTLKDIKERMQPPKSEYEILKISVLLASLSEKTIVRSICSIAAEI